MAVKAPPELVTGSLWRHDHRGRQVVRVVAVWTTDRGPVVRARPVRGGCLIEASAAWFCENYTPQ